MGLKMKKIRSKELQEYFNRIGGQEYFRQYCQLYAEAKQKKTRYSQREYINSKEKLARIKQKYRNGVTSEILDEMMQNL